MIGLTTGRQTTQRLNILLKERAHTIPSSKTTRRGKSSLKELAALFREQGAHHALALYRWHGGPGRIDLFDVQATGLASVAPSILLKSVRLRREHPHRGRYTAQGVACDPKVSDETRNFSQRLSKMLELSRPDVPPPPELKTTFHIAEIPNGFHRLVVTSPPGEREVGPSFAHIKSHPGYR